MARINLVGVAKLVNGAWVEVPNFKKMGKFYVACQLQERLVEPTQESIFEKIAVMPASKSPFTMEGSLIGVVTNEGLLKTQKKIVMYAVLYRVIEENKTEVTANDLSAFDNMFAEEANEESGL